MFSWFLVIALLIMTPQNTYEIRIVRMQTSHQTELACADEYMRTMVKDMPLKPGEQIIKAAARCDRQLST